MRDCIWHAYTSLYTCILEKYISRAVARLGRRRRLPPLILGQESKKFRMQEDTVPVRILRIVQQISPPPFLRSGYGPDIRGFMEHQSLR